jgi:hypothetical protein
VKPVDLIEFRRALGPVAEGKSDEELLQRHAALQWIADQAIAHALRVHQPPALHLVRSA